MAIDSLRAAGVSKRYGNHRALAAVEVTARPAACARCSAPTAPAVDLARHPVDPGPASDGRVHYRDGETDTELGPSCAGRSACSPTTPSSTAS